MYLNYHKLIPLKPLDVTVIALNGFNLEFSLTENNIINLG